MINLLSSVGAILFYPIKKIFFIVFNIKFVCVFVVQCNLYYNVASVLTQSFIQFVFRNFIFLLLNFAFLIFPFYRKYHHRRIKVLVALSLLINFSDDIHPFYYLRKRRKTLFVCNIFSSIIKARLSV